jgi:uncharacterized delta-60 repeat protein
VDVKKGPLYLLIALIALAVPALAQAKAGRLDPSFSGDGKAAFLFGVIGDPEIAPASDLAWAGKGKIVVAIGQTVTEFLPDGRVNRQFGADGKLRIELPSDSRSFELAGVEADSRGRIVVAGTLRSGQGEWSVSALIARYTPNGRPDPGFGSGGTIVTTFGLPAPPTPPALEFPPPPSISGPIVEVTGLAIDARDRILLAGARVSEFSLCYPFTSYSPIETAFLARLNEGGAADPSFGSSGAQSFAGKEAAFSPLPTGAGVIFITARINCQRASAPSAELGRVDEGGQPDPDFAAKAHLPPEAAGILATAQDSGGRLLVLGYRFESEGLSASLQRLNADGYPARRFGKGGTVQIRLPKHSYFPFGPRTQFLAVAADQRSRPVVATTLQHVGEDAAFVLLRRKGDGAVDSSFGKRGRVSTRFRGSAYSQGVLVGGSGKIVVGGTLIQGDHYGIALARYQDR